MLSIFAAGCGGGAETVRTETSEGAAPTTAAPAPTTTTTVEPSTTTAASPRAAPPPPATAAEPPVTTAAAQPAAPPSPPAEAASAETAEPAPPDELTERVVAALADRSFRQFDPGRDADKRKAVILDFFAGIELWAQYAKGEHALVEWQIRADSYRVESGPGASEVTLYFVDPRGSQILPTECSTCVESRNVSISVLNVFDAEQIAFKVNDPYGVLQSPFPVFDNWTRFEEDELFD